MWDQTSEAQRWELDHPMAPAKGEIVATTQFLRLHQLTRCIKNMFLFFSGFFCVYSKWSKIYEGQLASLGCVYTSLALIFGMFAYS